MSFEEYFTLADMVGYLGGAITLWGMYRRTMIPLRVGAVAGNIGLLVFGFLTESYPTMVLHATLLPLNALRLAQMMRLIREIGEATDKNSDIMSTLLPYMKRQSMKKGTVLFNQGDVPDTMYLIHAGVVHLEKLQIDCSEGDVLGEIAAFSPENKRTDTALCTTDCVIYSLENETMLQLFHQNPRFGLYLTRTIVGRLVRNWQDAEARAKSLT